LAPGIIELKKDGMASARASLWRRDGPVLALFFALTILMTNPLVLHLADAVEDKQDGLLNTWIIAWVGHALTTDPLHLFDANIFYPYRNTLAFSEVLLPQGLLALPINLASGNTILGYNLVLLFSFLLAAYGMYLLVLDLTYQRAAGIVAGIIFAFNPFNLGNLAQVQLLSFGWLPLALLALHRVIAPGPQTAVGPQTADRRPPTMSSSGFASGEGLADLTPGPFPKGKGGNLPDLKYPLLFALFFSLQVLSSIYYGFLAGVAVAFYVSWSLIRYRSLRFTFYVSVLVRLSISAIIIAVLVVPILLPYLQVQRELGFERKIEESEQFSASLKLYTEVSPQNVVYGSFLSPRQPVTAGCYPQDNLFPGLAAVALGIAGIIASRNRERWFYLCLLFFAFVFSLGPRLYLTPIDPTSILLPYRWLYDAIPLTHALRAPVRFDALVMLGVAVLAGMGMQAVSRRQKAVGSKQKAVSRKQKAKSLLLPFVLCLFTLLEYLTLPAANIAPVPVGGAIPAYVPWLAQQPRATVLELPMMEPACPLDLTMQYLSTYHWKRTPDGYSGFNPKPRGGIAYEMQFLPSERAMSLLQALDVDLVVIHSAGFQDWDTRGAALARTTDLQFVQQFGGDYIYRVAPHVDTAPSLEASIYLPNAAGPNQGYTAYLMIRNLGQRSFAIKPTETLQVDARWSDGTRQQVSAVMPLVTSSMSVVPLQLTSPRNAGTYRLELHVQHDGIGAWDYALSVTVSDEEPARQVVLPAQVTLDAPLNAVYAPGDTIDIGVTWQALNKIDGYYSVSVRVVDAQGNKKSDAGDRQPAVETMLWVPGSQVPDRFSLTLPRDLAPGEYTVQVLMYQADFGVDALLLDKGYVPRETIELGKFAVK
jgi:hypothetical protein